MLGVDAGPEVALEQLAAAGVRTARAPEAGAPDAIPEKIAFVGRDIGREAEAGALAEARARVAALSERPREILTPGRLAPVYGLDVAVSLPVPGRLAVTPLVTLPDQGDPECSSP